MQISPDSQSRPTRAATRDTSIASLRHSRGYRLAVMVAGVLLAGCMAKTEPPAPLPKLDIDPARVAVAGLSSGGYMATQAHIGFSDHLHGAAILAGGPYGCAQDDLATALGTCMKGAPNAPDVDALARRVRERATAGSIAPLSGLDGDVVWVWHGSEDKLVAESVSRAGATLYEELGGATVTWHGDLKAGHGFPVSEGDPAKSGDACSAPKSPFLAQCGFDAAGALMQALFDQPAAAIDPAKPGTLREFDQRPYVATGADAASPQMADEGYVYIPAACASDAQCGLLVVFHGCEQNAGSVGDAFVTGTGLNGWADRYDVVVLYPQVKASLAPLNPKACWDWWGYTGANYDTRDGAQPRWLNAATSALGAPLR